jgi:transcriptional regulator with PAS, ATPase and Fis domain
MTYSEFSWIKEFPTAITITDAEGLILEMNDKAALTFASDGGYALVGTSVLNCHPELARSKLAALMEGRRTNVYTIEKKGVKKLIYQAPWFKDGQYAGFIEFSFEIPVNLPHFIRD